MNVRRVLCRIAPLGGLLCAGAALAQSVPTAEAPAQAPPAAGATAPAAQPGQQPTPGDAAAAPAAPVTGATPDSAGGQAAQAPAAPVAPAPIAADPAELERAKGHFKQGIAFAKSGDCSAAIVELKAAYAIVPRPNMLYNIAQCEERLFRYDLAVKYYEQYLAEAPADAPDRSAVEAALKTLANLLGTIAVRSNVPAEVWVGERLAGEAPGDVLLPAGSHTIELRADGYIPKRKEVSIVGHDTIALEFELVKAQTTIEVTETTGVPPVVFWAGVTATTAAAVVGAVFAFQAKSRYDDAQSINRFDPQRDVAQGDIEAAEFNADLSFAIAGALGLGTAIVGFMTDWEGDTVPETQEEAEQRASVRVTPLLGRSQLGLQVGGTL